MGKERVADKYGYIARCFQCNCLLGNGGIHDGVLRCVKCDEEYQTKKVPAPAPSFTVSNQTLYSIVVLIAVLLFCYIATGDPLAAFNQSYTGRHNSP